PRSWSTTCRAAVASSFAAIEAASVSAMTARFDASAARVNATWSSEASRLASNNFGNAVSGLTQPAVPAPVTASPSRTIDKTGSRDMSLRRDPMVTPLVALSEIAFRAVRDCTEPRDLCGQRVAHELELLRHGRHVRAPVGTPAVGIHQPVLASERPRARDRAAVSQHARIGD